jgi:Peptidase dimerisation domain.
VLTLEMTAKGADFDNHSGNTGNIVPNPAWKLMRLLNTMRDDDGNVLVDGFYDKIRKPSDKEMELLKRLPYDQQDIAEKIGYEDLDMDGASYYHKLTMEPTFNIAGIESGIQVSMRKHYSVDGDGQYGYQTGGGPGPGRCF